MNARDMTQQQFDDACKRHGFIAQGYLGYYQLPDSRTRVSILNAGSRRRDQLAYLIRERDRLEKKAASL